MLHVINRHNQSEYADQLEESFRIRHRIYVDERGWEDLRRPDDREVDQFDNDDAVYLVYLSDDRRKVLGGSRLVPTTKPNLMSEVFPQLASERPLPCAPDIYEWTRFYVIPEARDSHRTCAVADMIMCGVQEYCLGQGINTLSIVTEPFWIPRFLTAGWNPKPLGLPIEHKGMDVIGITVDVGEHVLESTRASRELYKPLLFRPTQTATEERRALH